MFIPEKIRNYSWNKSHVEVVKYLLEKGADCEHKTDEMHTALMEACMDGHIEVAKVLIEHGANVNMPADSFESPLTLAACGGHVELADLLIDNHADLEERNDEGYTPLMEAAREGHEEMVALLLFHDADINAITDETQETALTLACCGGCYEVAKFLLEAGADPNLGNASTPLMEAAQEGHLELVQLLIKAGADVNKFYTALITNGQNTTQNITSCESALSLACENGHTDVAAALIKAGAEADMADPDKGFTPLMKAARSGQLCTVQYLIGNCSVDVNRTTKNNESTALSLASSNGHIQLIELLLQHGANPLYVLKDNSNCLIEASKNGHVKIVELLIDWNYSLNEMDEAKKTKRKNLKINLKPKMTSQTHVHTGDQTLSPSSSLVKQIRKSVTKLDTTSELGVENLVNVLHHFAFGDMTPSESKAKKKRNKDDISLELLKIEKQLEVQRKSKVKSHNSNYDHMSMINKYLIKRCQCELNRLYKIKLKQLQEQKINEIKADSKISKKCIGKKCGATTTSTTISTTNSTT
ncbi:ankyrin repeat domain-containing, partial [Brachionus plicatilis]